MKYKVAVIDDDVQIIKVLIQSLESEGYLVETANDGREAVKLLTRVKPDLVILDWNLPEMSGIEICQFLRSYPPTSKVPVLMLTVFEEVGQKVSAFELGADDYLTKPFDVKELLARVKALLRRGQPSVEGPRSVIKADMIRVDEVAHKVTVGGRQIQLRPKEFELLCVLLKSPGRVVTREYLVERVWGYNPKLITTRTVDSHIARLRGKLGSRASKVIQTIPGFGFKVEKVE